MDFDAAVKAGLIRTYDPVPAYDARIRSLVDVEAIKDAGFTVLVDNMWGNGAGYLSRFIAGGATQVVEYHAERNPIFPEMQRPEPIPPNVDAGLAKARAIGADAVCILDGDADRCGFGDENGEFVDQLRVYGLLAMYLLEVRGERGPIVKTLSTTSMLDKLGERYGVPVYQHRRRLQVRRAGDDGARWPDRRRGERRLRLPRPRPRARRHPGATSTCWT